MAELPSNAPSMFQLPGPSVPYQGNLATGAAAGAQIGTGTFLGEQQIANQQALYQVEMQKMKVQAHQAQVDSALNFMGKIGEQLKYFGPDSQKQAIANGMNVISKAAPEWKIPQTDPTQIPDEAVDLVKQFGTLRSAHLEGKVSDADFQMEAGSLMSKMSEFQRGMLKDQESVLGQPKYEPGQTPTGQPTTFNPGTGVTAPAPQAGTQAPFQPTTTVMREQNTRQMAAAQAAVPYVQTLKSYHTAINALDRNDQLGDRVAIGEVGKVLGVTSTDELKAMAKSGTLGTKIQQHAEEIIGTGSLTAGQRNELRQVLALHMQGSQKASEAQTALYPGATGPNLSVPITKTLKNGKTVASSDGGKTWFYSK